MIPLILFVILCIIIIILLLALKWVWGEYWEMKQEREFDSIKNVPSEAMDYTDQLLVKDDEVDKYTKCQSRTLAERTKRYQSNGKGFNIDERD